MNCLGGKARAAQKYFTMADSLVAVFPTSAYSSAQEQFEDAKHLENVFSKDL